MTRHPVHCHRRNDPLTQIHRIRLRHARWPPAPSKHLESENQTQGNPHRIRLTSSRSSVSLRPAADHGVRLSTKTVTGSACRTAGDQIYILELGRASCRERVSK